LAMIRRTNTLTLERFKMFKAFNSFKSFSGSLTRLSGSQVNLASGRWPLASLA
jgi:hypothetical protein